MFLLHVYVFSQIWLEAFKVNKLLHLKTVFCPFGSSLCFHSLFHRYLKYVLENLPERLLLQKLTMVKFKMIKDIMRSLEEPPGGIGYIF